MAEQDENKSAPLPTIPSKNWWQLRAEFKKSIPSTVTTDYLIAKLGISSGRAGIVQRALISLHLLDEKNKPTDLANRWRHDEDYPAVCEEIRRTIYPQALRDIDEGPEIDRGAVQGWVSRNKGVGQEQAGQITQVYALLCKADPTEEKASNVVTRKVEPTPKRVSAPAKPEPKPANQEPQQPTAETPASPPSSAFKPAIHIDLQIHINPESSVEQIDAIFASMAKYLYQVDKG